MSDRGSIVYLNSSVEPSQIAKSLLRYQHAIGNLVDEMVVTWRYELLSRS